MLEGMSGKCCMVHLGVYFKVFVQPVMTEKTDNSRAIIIVLVFGWFTWLWFNKEHPFKPLFTCIVARHTEEPSKVIHLPLHVCVKQRHITFTSTPENIVFTTECNCCVDGIFDLCCGVGKSMKIGIG